jgi:hypothetical protein
MEGLLKSFLGEAVVKRLKGLMLPPTQKLPWGSCRETTEGVNAAIIGKLNRGFQFIS